MKQNCNCYAKEKPLIKPLNPHVFIIYIMKKKEEKKKGGEGGGEC